MTVGRIGNKETQWRIFCAVELPEEVRAQAAAQAALLRERAPHVRASWERPEKMHLTLKFLGEIESERVERLQSAATRSAASVAKFSISVEGAGAFPVRGPARVLWLGVRDEPGNLARLQSRLEEECGREGFMREAKQFHPHLTIARLRTPAGARTLAALHRETSFASPSFTVAELVVIRSELTPEGSRYTILSRHNLNNDAEG
jgi:2'-5' RNA ligase